MSAFDADSTRALLVMCVGSREGADFLTRVIGGIEGRELSDAELRAMALGARYGIAAARHRTEIAVEALEVIASYAGRLPGAAAMRGYARDVLVEMGIHPFDHWGQSGDAGSSGSMAEP